MIQLDMPRHMAVKLGVDPETLRITPDGIVRYVMVAQSPSGTVNATYEGIRCLTAGVEAPGMVPEVADPQPWSDLPAITSAVAVTLGIDR